MRGIKDPDKTFRFRNFQAYKDARQFTKDLKVFSKNNFPKEEQFGLLPQLWRALDSVILNIAEGSDRGMDKDFALFLNRSHTSLNEVVACLDIAMDIGYISAEENAHWVSKAAILARQLTAFRKHVLSNQSK